MLAKLTRRLIKTESKLKLAEDENNRNFRESKEKFIQSFAIEHNLQENLTSTEEFRSEIVSLERTDKDEFRTNIV